MTDSELIALVRGMRAAQKSYFRYRDSLALEESKAPEQQVDRELERRTNPQRSLLRVMKALTRLLSQIVWRVRVTRNRLRPWAAVLTALDDWERRPDHNIGQGLRVIDAHIVLWSDGSGKVLVELSTVCERLDDKGADISNLLTNLGAIGRMTKEYNFDSYADALMILSRPITLAKAATNHATRTLRLHQPE